MVMVELLLRNLLVTMWYFISVIVIFCGCCDPLDVATAVVIIM